MAKRINNIRDIPQWFKLSNYDRENNFELCNWLGEFNARREIEQVLNKQEKIIKGRLPSRHTTKLLEKIQNGGINDSTCTDIKHLKIFDNKSPLRFTGQRSVIEFTPKERDDAFKDIKKACYLAGLVDEYAESAYSTFHQLLNIDIKFLEIDTRASDAQLREDFDAWLKFYRSQLPASKIMDISQAAVEKWGKYRILAYIDLMQWSRIEHASITSALLSNLLFPEGAVDDSRIKTTLPSLMSEVLSDPFISKLNRKVKAKGQLGLLFF